MPTSNIRKATECDLDRIAAIHVRSSVVAYTDLIAAEVFNPPSVEHRRKLWAEMFPEADQQLFVSELDELIVGFCHLMPSRDDDAPPDTGEITSIYLDPDIWRTGIGSQLARHVLDFARDHAGFKEVTLWVLAENHPARRFYEMLGMKSDGKVVNLDKRPGFTLEEVRYRRML